MSIRRRVGKHKLGLGTTSDEPPTLEHDRDPYLDTLAAGLEITLDDLEQEVAAQAEQSYRVGRELDRLVVYSEVSARGLVVAKNRVEAQLRRAMRERGLTVTVDDDLEVQVLAHSDVDRATSEHIEARRRMRAVKTLYRAFEQRAVMLTCLVNLQSRKG